ncbi:Leukocyte immunoglobulin-like receptor subfamily A member [Actinidia chinensis var. chinensis]|uniref:Leukocyte immunoglobulin-like receptor subfamily A member n=1 Tax=Actinidia chinensis var. chinensis TaxID=1590841 RepID=A0A2R6RRV1_ACTCC|nr:Leukocyte immunoglobulin-like receptor subfamily A member [Actinidia chinensis var. chinensis]
MDGIEVILRRFEDEQSTLLDQFERLSLEAQLSRAILGRSLSEPSTSTNQPPQLLLAPPPGMAVAQQDQPGRRRGAGSGFKKVMKRLIKPILRRRPGGRKEGPDPKDPRLWKAFSRSMRV